MAPSTTVRSPWSIFKRLRISHPSPAATFGARQRSQEASSMEEEDGPDHDLSNYFKPRSLPRDFSTAEDPLKPNARENIRDELFSVARERGISIPSAIDPNVQLPRPPRNITATRSSPLKRPATHNIPVAQLQLRSYSARNLEVMADFALRAAYYLKLPARGPIPLPRITERWAVPRGPFVHKKTQDNWERITMRRLIHVVDGHPDVVREWLAFIRKWTWYGVGMKANVWEWESLDVGEKMDSMARQAGEQNGPAQAGVDWTLFGRRSDLNSKDTVAEFLDWQGFGAPPGNIPEAAPPYVATEPSKDQTGNAKRSAAKVSAGEEPESKPARKGRQPKQTA